MNTVERLQGYYLFSDETLAAVEQAHGVQSTYDTYQEYFKSRLGLPDTLQAWHGQQVLDLRPPEHDPAKALLLELAMGNALDDNQIFQIGTIAEANPDWRIIAFANPSGPGRSAGKLQPADRQLVVRGDLSPITDERQSYLDMHGVTATSHAGFSYGADLAAQAAIRLRHQVDHLITIEPASVKPRSLWKLGRAFISTGKALPGYVEASGQPLFEAARDNSISQVAYGLGLARLSNIAIARALTKDGYELRMDRALMNHPDLKATIVWGSKSELAEDALMLSIVKQLRSYDLLRKDDAYTGSRIHDIRLVGQKHNMVNDIYLQSGIVHEALNFPLAA